MQAAEPKTELEKDVLNFLMIKKAPQVSNIIQDSRSVGSDTVPDNDMLAGGFDSSKGPGMSIGRVNASPSKLGMKSAALKASPNRPYVSSAVLTNNSRVNTAQSPRSLALSK